MGEAARRSAQRYAWPHVADRVTAVYERAIEVPRARQRPASGPPTGPGCGPPTGPPPVPPQRLPSLDPPPARAGNRGRAIARRAGLGVAGASGLA